MWVMRLKCFHHHHCRNNPIGMRRKIFGVHENKSDFKFLSSLRVVWPQDGIAHGDPRFKCLIIASPQSPRPFKNLLNPPSPFKMSNQHCKKSNRGECITVSRFSIVFFQHFCHTGSSSQTLCIFSAGMDLHLWFIRRGLEVKLAFKTYLEYILFGPVCVLLLSLSLSVLGSKIWDNCLRLKKRTPTKKTQFKFFVLAKGI